MPGGGLVDVCVGTGPQRGADNTEAAYLARPATGLEFDDRGGSMALWFMVRHCAQQRFVDTACDQYELRSTFVCFSLPRATATGQSFPCILPPPPRACHLKRAWVLGRWNVSGSAGGSRWRRRCPRCSLLGSELGVRRAAAVESSTLVARGAGEDVSGGLLFESADLSMLGGWYNNVPCSAVTFSKDTSAG